MQYCIVVGEASLNILRMLIKFNTEPVPTL